MREREETNQETNGSNGGLIKMRVSTMGDDGGAAGRCTAQHDDNCSLRLDEKVAVFLHGVVNIFSCIGAVLSAILAENQKSRFHFVSYLRFCGKMECNCRRKEASVRFGDDDKCLLIHSLSK